jgi:hypothetical protein
MHEGKNTTVGRLKEIVALRRQIAQLTTAVTDAEQLKALTEDAQQQAYGRLERQLQQRTVELVAANEARQVEQSQHRQLQEDLQFASGGAGRA